MNLPCFPWLKSSCFSCIRDQPLQEYVSAPYKVSSYTRFLCTLFYIQIFSSHNNRKCLRSLLLLTALNITEVYLHSQKLTSFLINWLDLQCSEVYFKTWNVVQPKKILNGGTLISNAYVWAYLDSLWIVSSHFRRSFQHFRHITGSKGWWYCQ